MWYFKLYYLPVLTCLRCLSKFSWCLLASSRVSKNTNLRATGFKQNKYQKETVAVCLDTLCYKQTVNAKCTALLSATLSHHMLELCLRECLLTCSFSFSMLPWIQREVNDFCFSIILCVYPSSMHQIMLASVFFYQWTEAKLRWVNLYVPVTFSPCFNSICQVDNCLLVCWFVFFFQVPNPWALEQFKIVRYSDLVFASGVLSSKFTCHFLSSEMRDSGIKIPLFISKTNEQPHSA